MSYIFKRVKIAVGVKEGFNFRSFVDRYFECSECFLFSIRVCACCLSSCRGRFTRAI